MHNNMENDGGGSRVSTGIRRIAPMPEKSQQVAPQPVTGGEKPGAAFFARESQALDEIRAKANGAAHASQVDVAVSEGLATDLSPEGKKKEFEKFVDRWSR
jgi:hypothetical protein